MATDTPLPADDDLPSRGRRLKLTKEITEGICEAVRNGNFPEVAAKRMGVGVRTFYTWMKLGRKFPDGIYGAFRQAILKSSSDCEIDAVAAIREAGQEDVRHLQWLLERRYGKRWSRAATDLQQLKLLVAELEAQADAQDNSTTASEVRTAQGT